MLSGFEHFRLSLKKGSWLNPTEHMLFNFDFATTSTARFNYGGNFRRLSATVVSHALSHSLDMAGPGPVRRVARDKRG